MISIKPGAKVKGIQPEILLGLFTIYYVFKEHYLDLVITEGTGGEHVEGSLHYTGQAFDIRSHDIEGVSVKEALLKQCQTALGDDYDMMLEDLGAHNEHYHVQFKVI